MTTNDLRRKYLEFFKSNGHKVVSSDSLVPTDDPTVLFTSAGMNQFKKQFLGEVDDFRRAVSCQKCLRTDDLDKVGHTPGHHTFFEMLGNFSFGDYFKHEAIVWAWEFMAEVLNITPKKLWVSVYKDDEEAHKIWRDSIKLPESKILKLGDENNFWPANAIVHGPNGPCGPCSEIFYDRGKDVGCKKPDCTPICNCGRFVEVWNLVFTQFERKGEIGKKGMLDALPNKNIDTGMGLERMASVLQDTDTNFKIDIFKPIVKEIEKLVAYRTPNLGNLYAIADHARAIVFAISDGVMPSNEERGYVVRKLIRRAFLNAFVSGNKRPFIYKIVPKVCEVMKGPYPDLISRRENISLIIKAEEERFCETLKEGERVLAGMKSLVNKKALSADEAFKLYDTYGYPLELLKKKGIKFDEEAIYQLMQRQRAQSKKASGISGEVFAKSKTESIDFKTEFLGYAAEAAEAIVLATITQSNQTLIILDKTPFYPEAGGQVADTGRIEAEGKAAEVHDTKRINGAIVHYVKITRGGFNKGDRVKAIVDSARRLDIARNHTATHLLQAALRKVLGEHIQQQGSLVSSEYLRFDFTHFKALTREEFFRVEELVNEYIRRNDKVVKQSTSLAQARKSGALAFFAEKYEDKVRMVSVANYSKELCAGIHLEGTGQIGLFKMISESSIASGIRRIEALTGKYAYERMQEEEGMLSDLSREFKVSKDRLKEEIENKLAYIKKLEKELSAAKLKIFESHLPLFLKKAVVIKDIRLLVADIGVQDMQYMRKALDLLKNKIERPCIIFLFSKFAGSGLFVVSLSGDLLKKKGYDAKKIIQNLGLKGGGRADLVQGGMKNKDWKMRRQDWEELFDSSGKIEKIIIDTL